MYPSFRNSFVALLLLLWAASANGQEPKADTARARQLFKKAQFHFKKARELAGGDPALLRKIEKEMEVPQRGKA